MRRKYLQGASCVTLMFVLAVLFVGYLSSCFSFPESTNASSRSGAEDETYAKVTGLVGDANRSLGMTFDELKNYWSRAELLRLDDDLSALIGYPDIVVTTFFFFKGGKVSSVNYSFGNYSRTNESSLVSMYTRRYGNPVQHPGTYNWAVGGTIFSLGKEEYPYAESGYILSLICFRP